MKENSRRLNFLSSFPVVSVEAVDNDHAKRSKFNFSYFSTQEQAGQSFSDWSHAELIQFFEKLSHFSKETLTHWTKARAGGKSGHILEIYGKFPHSSKFTLPSHVPHQAMWGRFRLDTATRVAGFVLPQQYDRMVHSCGFSFDCNTFYVVFLDKNHEFFVTR